MGRKPIEMIRKTELTSLLERIKYLEEDNRYYRSRERNKDREDMRKASKSFDLEHEIKNLIKVISELGKIVSLKDEYIYTLQIESTYPLENNFQLASHSDNKEKVLAEEVPKKSASLRKPKQHKPKPKRRKQK